jgi:hypothetical protein
MSSKSIDQGAAPPGPRLNTRRLGLGGVAASAAAGFTLAVLPATALATGVYCSALKYHHEGCKFYHGLDDIEWNEGENLSGGTAAINWYNSVGRSDGTHYGGGANSPAFSEPYAAGTAQVWNESYGHEKIWGWIKGF